jgi:hypothetical protein
VSRLLGIHRPLTAQAAPRVEDAIFIACGLAWCASLIHVQAAIAHLSENALYALFFALLAPLQFIWGLAICRRPAPALLRAGAVMSLGIAGLWLATRTTGLPVGSSHWRPEPVGAGDSLATADEVVTAFLCLYPSGLTSSVFLRRGLRKAVMAGGLGLILFSSLALAILGAGH